MRADGTDGGPQLEFTIGADEPFKVGSRYVVFAAGKPLSTTLLCKWSELESEAGKKRQWLASRPVGVRADGARSAQPVHRISRSASSAPRHLPRRLHATYVQSRREILIIAQRGVGCPPVGTVRLAC